MRERREFTRIEYYVEIGCEFYINADGTKEFFKKPERMVMLNLSIGGIALVTDIEIENSAMLSFTLVIKKVPNPITARVMWRAKKGEMYQYGLEFLDISDELNEKIIQIINEEQTIFIEYV